MTLVGIGLLLLGSLTIWRAARTPNLSPPGEHEAVLASPGGRSVVRPASLRSLPAWLQGMNPVRFARRREAAGERVRTEPWPAAGGRGRFRAGPWPGLAPAGAVVLVGCAMLLAGGQVLVGDRLLTPLPGLPLLAVLAVCPVLLATRLVGAPGVASAVCGAYLLPRTLLSLVDPSLEPPPLLLVAAVTFDVSAWLRWGDLANLRRLLPGRQSAWRRRRVGPRRVGRLRAAVAGAVFGGVLAMVEAPFAVLLGADPAAWSGTSVWVAGGVATLGCAIAGLIVVSGRGTAA